MAANLPSPPPTTVRGGRHPPAQPTPPAAEERPMIRVIAVITAKPGMRDTVMREFRANMPAVHAEQGCIEYAPADAAEGMGFPTPFGPDTFVAIEKWESPEALKAPA